MRFKYVRRGIKNTYCGMKQRITTSDDRRRLMIIDSTSSNLSNRLILDVQLIVFVAQLLIVLFKTWSRCIIAIVIWSQLRKLKVFLLRAHAGESLLVLIKELNRVSGPVTVDATRLLEFYNFLLIQIFHKLFLWTHVCTPEASRAWVCFVLDVAWRKILFKVLLFFLLFDS